MATAAADQVDVIVCDANLFRQFKQDRHSDPVTGSVLTILDQILAFANKLREPHQRVAYNFEVSTLTERLAALAGQDADVDCLMQIALNYGKDMYTLVKRTSDFPDYKGRIGYDGPPRQKETLITANEYLKHLNHLDLCLRSSDHDLQHPFQCTSNSLQDPVRGAGEASAQYRKEKDKERSQRRRQERWQSTSWQSSASSSSWHQSNWDTGYRGYNRRW